MSVVCLPIAYSLLLSWRIRLDTADALFFFLSQSCPNIFLNFFLVSFAGAKGGQNWSSDPASAYIARRSSLSLFGEPSNGPWCLHNLHVLRMTWASGFSMLWVLDPAWTQRTIPGASSLLATSTVRCLSDAGILAHPLPGVRGWTCSIPAEVPKPAANELHEGWHRDWNKTRTLGDPEDDVQHEVSWSQQICVIGIHGQGIQISLWKGKARRKERPVF